MTNCATNEPHADVRLLCRIWLQLIRLEFFTFEVQSCSFISLRVYEGTSSTGTLRRTLCGNALPESFTSRTNSLYLSYTYNWERKDSFKIKYSAVPRCKYNVDWKLLMLLQSTKHVCSLRLFPTKTLCMLSVCLSFNDKMVKAKNKRNVNVQHYAD